MIRKVHIQNFKSLRDVSIAPERFTVFVGPNASGKTSILQGLDWLCRLFRIDHPQNSERDLCQGLSRGATSPIELAGETGEMCFRYRTRSEVKSPPLKPGTWLGDGCATAASIDSSDWKQWPHERTKSTPLPLSVLLRLEASKLIRAGAPSPDASVMSPDGAGLHSALASMTLNDPDSWQALQANLRRIIPTIRRLRHTGAASMQQPASLLFDTIGAESLPADQVSEGTLVVLGLLAALHAPGRPSLVLLDDLDRGLHPKAQRELIALLRSLLDTSPDLQILASSHSPYLLDCMDPTEVWMTHLNDEGSTVCAPLTQHPKFEKWKDEFHSGEMWSMFGEKWVVAPETVAP